MKATGIISAIAASTLLLASCGTKTFTINGIADDEVARQEGSVVYLCDSEGHIQDSCLVKDGRFRFSGPLDVTSFIAFELNYPGKDKRFEDRTAVVIPDSREIAVCLNDSVYVDGSPLTDAFNEFQSELMRLYIESDDEGESAINYCREVFLANKDNIVGSQALGQIIYDLEIDEIDQLMDQASDFISQNPRYQKVREGKRIEAKTAPGAMFIDFEGVTPEGEPVKLSDFVGKGSYTLVDFWASWCGPCMRSIPGLKLLYERYAPRGLKLVGVAVWDGDNSASRARIVEKGMTWPQIFVGSDMTATDSYGIMGIPHVILFAPDGTIVSRQIPDEDQLDIQLATLLK